MTGIRRWIAMGGLAVALLAAGRLVTLPEPAGRGAPPAGPAPPAALTDVWPAARIAQAPGRLADDRAYTPWFYLDAQASVGTALTPDGAAVRLVLRGGDGAVHELQRLPAAANPQFNGFATAGDDLVWMASTVDRTGQTRTALYRAGWRPPTGAVMLTTDVGEAMFLASQYDVVAADGRVHWAAAAPSERPVTELRSVPLGGGRVDLRRLDGGFVLSAWPWLTSAGSGQTGPVELLNLATGERRRVPASQAELVACSPTWCRVLVLGAAGGAARIDLMRPDGSGRVRVAAGSVTAAVLDVALVDRFEVLSNAAPPNAGVTVLLHDLRTDRTVLVATEVATVQARGPVLWWSVGEEGAATWYALDLRTLA